jgi:hypothetical protein
MDAAAIERCFAQHRGYFRCASLRPEERMQGVWATAPETSGFVPGAAVMPNCADFAWDRVLFEPRPGAALHPAVQDERNQIEMPVAIAVEFIGRRSLGVGRFGMGPAHQFVVADRFVSARCSARSRTDRTRKGPPVARRALLLPRDRDGRGDGQ